MIQNRTYRGIASYVEEMYNGGSRPVSMIGG